MTDIDQKLAVHHRASLAVSTAVGHAAALAVVTAGVLVWTGVGFWLSFPTEWLLASNLAWTVAIFLILLAIRYAQQMQMRAIHAKLDELIRASEGGNHMIGSERLADELLDELRKKHRELAAKGKS
jgi:low affinity Fe/Cu permease